MNKLLYLLIPTAFLLLSGCVSMKKFNEEEALVKSLRNENNELLGQLEDQAQLQRNLEETIGDLKLENAKKDKEIAELQADLNKQIDANKELNNLYEEMVLQNKSLLASSSKERQKLTEELAAKERALQEKEMELEDKQANINKLLDELKAREKRVNELQALVDKKDAAINNLKAKIEKALLNFDDEDLTVEIRDGKIYVSLAEQLLFKSGSTVVDPKGQEALIKLAEVLEKQEDISIMIEGHTDSIPISTNSIKDNWDLSVLRATAIVRIITEKSNIDRERVIPSGRGEEVPVASNKSKEGRAKNRRTEIILSPNLDEIFKILESDGEN